MVQPQNKDQKLMVETSANNHIEVSEGDTQDQNTTETNFVLYEEQGK